MMRNIKALKWQLEIFDMCRYLLAMQRLVQAMDLQDNHKSNCIQFTVTQFTDLIYSLGGHNFARYIITHIQHTNFAVMSH